MSLPNAKASLADGHLTINRMPVMSIAAKTKEMENTANVNQIPIA